MNIFKKIGYLSLIATALSISASFASGKGTPPKTEEEKGTAQKIGYEAARVNAQVEGVASDVKDGFKDGKKKFKGKYKKHK